MTTNAGSSTGAGTAGFGISEKAAAENKTEKALSEFLRPEFMNRVDEIITFRHLDKDDFRRIAANMIGDLGKALAEKGIGVNCTEEALALIAEKSFSVKYGARNMRRFISRNVEDAAAEKMISAYDKDIKEIYIYAEDDEICVDVR
jgi:ATP-dependent Clp protease ATP-binding subunit ClpA